MYIAHVEMKPLLHLPLFMAEAQKVGGSKSVDSGRVIMQYEFSNFFQFLEFESSVVHRDDVISVGYSIVKD